MDSSESESIETSAAESPPTSPRRRSKKGRKSPISETGLSTDSENEEPGLGFSQVSRRTSSTIHSPPTSPATKQLSFCSSQASRQSSRTHHSPPTSPLGEHFIPDLSEASREASDTIHSPPTSVLADSNDEINCEGEDYTDIEITGSPPTSPPSKKMKVLRKRKSKPQDLDLSETDEENPDVLTHAGSLPSEKQGPQDETCHSGDGQITAVLLQCNSSSSPVSSSDGNDSITSNGDNESIRSYADSASEVSLSNESDHSDMSDTDVGVPLFRNSPKSVDEAVLEVFDLYISNKWSKKSLQGVLGLLKSLLPADSNRMPSSLHYLLKYLESHSVPAEETAHFYCSSCRHSKPSENDVCSKCDSTETGKFFEISLADQIKYFFEVYGLAEVMDKFPHIREEFDLTSIQDGEEFRKVKSKCSGNYDVTLFWNTDGIKLRKSSPLSVWPILAVPCEVPFFLRRKFIFVCGIWVDRRKPRMKTFLKPFVQSLNVLWNDGVKWVHPVTREQFVSKVVAPVLGADAPAKANVLEVEEHQSKFACTTCEQEAQQVTVEIKKKGVNEEKKMRRFVYQENPSELRTAERIETQAELAKLSGKPVKGVKGLSVARNIPCFDLGSSAPTDYMHCVLGVVRRFTNLWCNVRGRWYIGDKLAEADEFISKQIEVTDFVDRLPGRLCDLKLWKANQLLIWLLFLSLPVLLFVNMPVAYVRHHVLLVKAMYNLLKARISPRDLEESERLLSLYVKDVQSLYRAEDLVYNVHSLLHLALWVRRWGNLFGFSLFLFEDFNGYLVSMIHGTKHHAKELINNLKAVRGVHALKLKAAKKTIVSGNLLTADNENRVELDRVRRANNLSEYEIAALREKSMSDVSTVCDRIIVNGKVFTSEKYDRKVKRANSYVKVHDAQGVVKFGQVQSFVRLADGDVFCLVEVFKVDQSRVFFVRDERQVLTIDHILPVIKTGEQLVSAFELPAIEDKLIKVGDFLCFRPNKSEVTL